MTTGPVDAAPLDVPAGFPAEVLAVARDSAMNRLLVSHDWSTSPLGPPQNWSPTLRAALGVCLNSRFPMLIWWGPELAVLYNDAYAPILGTKHPAALGAPGAQVWSEVWPVVGGMLDGVLRRGEATYDEDLLLVVRRHGFAEEAYFTFSCSPVVRPDGVVGGIFTAVTETTARVLAARRSAALHRLAAVPAGQIGDVALVADAVTAVLADQRADVPFGLIYLLDDGPGEPVRLVGACGLDTARVPRVVDGAVPGALAAAVAHAMAGGQVVSATGLAAELPGLSDAGNRLVGPTDVDTAIALPLIATTADRPIGVLVIGLSPFLAFDEGYRSLLELVAAQVVSAMTDAQALASQRGRAAELAELDRAKTAFFTGVSHELRTPLALIVGPVEDSLTDPARPLAPEHRERLEVVRRNAGRLHRLVDNLLDFARVDGAGLSPDVAAVDIGALSRGIAESFGPAAERAGLVMAVDSPDSAPAILVDPDMWEKVLLNLLSNAVKFTRAGSVHVAVRRFADEVTATVTDTGSGIPAVEVPRLFERFHRVRDADSRSHEGSGIGLALVDELVRLHGGMVEVASEPGRGSTFTVRIPARDADGAAGPVRPPRTVGRYLDEAVQWAEPTDPNLRPVTRGSGGTRTATLLIAEDNADLRAYLSRLLEADYRVVATADGETALRQARDEPPDLVLADVMMPRLDGFGLLAELRADQRTAAVPVILLSAMAGEEAAVEGLAAGADDYLVKPFTSAELLARVRVHLDLARARAEDSRRLRELAAATVAINAARTTPQTLEILARTARELTGAARAVVGLVGDPSPTISSVDDDTPPVGRAGTLREVLSAPMTGADGVDLGFVQLSDRAGGEFTADDRAIVTQLAGVGSAVLEKAQLLRRQTEVALTLQRSILGPALLPPGFAVRYEPAPGSLEVGGDWYDVLVLPGDRVGIVVGDVVGRGLLAAAVMGQLRSAARALLLQNHTPTQVLSALDTFAALTPGARCSTVFCAVIDPGQHVLDHAGAGHPPAILVGPTGEHRLLEAANSVPLAVVPGITRPLPARVALEPGSTLLLYTDGLVERRGESVDLGIERAAAALADGRDLEPERLAGQLADRLLVDGHDDDVAYLLYRHPHGREPFRVDVAARPTELAPLRRALRHRLTGLDQDTLDDLLLVTCEAVSNAMEHAYHLDDTQVVGVTVADSATSVDITVRDTGRWRPVPADPGHRGRGLQMMAALTDVLTIDRAAGGTAVHMTRRIPR